MAKAKMIIPIPNLLTTTIKLSSGRLERSNMLVPFPMVMLVLVVMLNAPMAIFSFKSSRAFRSTNALNNKKY